MTKNEKRVHALRIKARRRELEAPDSFWYAPVSELGRIYNGCGPEWMSKFGRRALTFAMREFEPAILVHDYRFELSDNTRKSFKTANGEFLCNCVKVANATFKWYDLRRYQWLWRAVVAWRFCVRGGWSAWNHNEIIKTGEQI